MNPRPRGTGDSGETLIELVIALLVLGLAVTAVLGAVGASSVLSGDHREMVRADVALKSVAEDVKALPYAAGASDSAYAAAGTTVYGLTVTTGPVRCWPGGDLPTTTASSFVACSTTDLGLQLVTITVRRGDGTTAESTQVMKRRS